MILKWIKKLFCKKESPEEPIPKKAMRYPNGKAFVAITRVGDSYYIGNYNKGVSPKIMVNDITITELYPLTSGDILTFGKIRVKFEVKYGKEGMS